jgi:hypothetical protein
MVRDYKPASGEARLLLRAKISALVAFGASDREIAHRVLLCFRPPQHSSLGDHASVFLQSSL